MDILGIGFPELVLIFIISMMVFGPRRLPELAAKAGKFVGDLRNMSRGLMTEWQREIAVASRLDELKKTQAELNQIKQEVKATRQEIAEQTSAGAKAMQQARQDIEDTQKSASSPAPTLSENSAENPSPVSGQPQTTADNEPSTDISPVSDSTQVANEQKL